MAFKGATDPSFRERLEAKDAPARASILSCMAQILEDPRQRGLRSGKLQGSGIWYSRASRSRRVTWDYGEERGTIVFHNHCDHDDVLNSPFG
jgi:hypothetical protein